MSDIVQMSRLYRDPTLQHQIDLTLARLILESVNVRAHSYNVLAVDTYHVHTYIYTHNRRQTITAHHKMALQL